MDENRCRNHPDRPATYINRCICGLQMSACDDCKMLTHHEVMMPHAQTCEHVERWLKSGLTRSQYTKLHKIKVRPM